MDFGTYVSNNVALKILLKTAHHSLLLFCTFNTYSDFFKERERGRERWRKDEGRREEDERGRRGGRKSTEIRMNSLDFGNSTLTQP